MFTSCVFDAECMNLCSVCIILNKLLKHLCTCLIRITTHSSRCFLYIYMYTGELYDWCYYENAQLIIDKF